MQPIQMVKLVVVGLGILIIIGIALLVYGFTARLAQPEATGSTDRTAVPLAMGPAFGEVRIALPEGCSVVDMAPAGDRLYLRTGPAAACERIIVIEAATGRALGTLLLRP